MAIVNKFLGFFDMKTAGVVIGVFYTVLNAALFGALIAFRLMNDLYYKGPADKTDETYERFLLTIGYNLDVGFYVILFSTIIGIFTSALLTKGVSSSKPHFILPFLSYYGLNITVYSIMIGYYLLIGRFQGYHTMQVLSLIAGAYSWICMFTLFREMKQQIKAAPTDVEKPGSGDDKPEKKVDEKISDTDKELMNAIGIPKFFEDEKEIMDRALDKTLDKAIDKAFEK